MRNLALTLLLGATCLAAMPASAQVRLYGDDDGDFGVRIGPGREYRDYDRRYDRERYDRRRVYRDDDCREIVVRRRLPDGSVSERRTERCD